MRVERSIELPVDADEVWEALVDDELLSDWLGDDVSLDPEPGGVLDVREGDEHRVGVVERVEPGRHLGLRWWPESRPDETSEVDLVLVPVTTGTRLTVVERRAVPVPIATASVATSKLVLLAATACRAGLSARR
ncbi:MAG: SRPBCC domain-containing protein [Actinomycetota bacterium]